MHSRFREQKVIVTTCNQTFNVSGYKKRNAASQLELMVQAAREKWSIDLQNIKIQNFWFSLILEPRVDYQNLTLDFLKHSKNQDLVFLTDLVVGFYMNKRAMIFAILSLQYCFSYSLYAASSFIAGRFLDITHFQQSLCHFCSSTIHMFRKEPCISTQKISFCACNIWQNIFI